MGTNTSSSGPNTHFVRSGDGLLPEVYHLTGIDNDSLWAYRMKNLLKCDSLFTWCLQVRSTEPTAASEKKGRELALSSITRNAKENALRLMRRFTDPYQLWQHQLKERHEANKNPRKVHLIEKFFSTRKTASMSMDKYLTEMKETADLLEEAGVPLSKDVIVWYTLKNLLKEYNIVKQMILCNSLPMDNRLELRHLAKKCLGKFNVLTKKKAKR